MAISADDDGRRLGSGCCDGCGARLAADQRYCLVCGGRRGAIPAAVAQWLSIVESDEADATPSTASAPSGDGEEHTSRSYMPEPRSAAVAVMCLLAFGVLLGGLTGPAAQSAGIAPIVLDSEAEPPPPAEPVTEPAAEATEPVAVAEGPAATAEVPLEVETTEEPFAAPPKKKLPPDLPEEPGLPPIQHVFVIVLADHGFEETYGPSSTATYMAKTLPEKGELLSNYYAVTTGDLANEIALISGQGPNPATAANCSEFKDFATPTLSATTGQAEGEGCVYPAETETLPGQLAAVKKTWKAYIGGIGNGQAGEPTTCRHPGLGEADPATAPRPGDPYETWRNPFVYFHSIVDCPECAERDIGLEQLSLDLKKEARTPSFSYIAPDACHDGSEVPCEPGAPTGLAAAQPWLETVIAEIEASPAYENSGLIAITSAQARQDLPEPDTSACCGTPEYPSLPATEAPPPASGPVKESGGGGRVGMLLLSPFVEPGSTNESGYYNHFSFLLSVGELLEATPPPGYAAEPALSAFDSTVFNSEEAPADATAPAGSHPGSRALRLPRRSHREQGRSGR
ncbi:MAG: alkaline phosphatase family protein [Thermoleophilia bacterium]